MSSSCPKRKTQPGANALGNEAPTQDVHSMLLMNELTHTELDRAPQEDATQQVSPLSTSSSLTASDQISSSSYLSRLVSPAQRASAQSQGSLDRLVSLVQRMSALSLLRLVYPAHRAYILSDVRLYLSSLNLFSVERPDLPLG